MNIGCFIKDLYTDQSRRSTISWLNALGERGHDLHVIFPRDVEEMRWRKYAPIKDIDAFFEQPNKHMRGFRANRKAYLGLRDQLGEDHPLVGQALDEKKKQFGEWKRFRKQWADQRFPYSISDPNIDVLLFRKSGRYFQRDNAQQVLDLADAYPQAGQINDAQLVANMDKTFMDRLDSQYTMDTRFPCTIDEVVSAVEEFEEAVIKPVDGRNGYGVSRVNSTRRGLEFIEQGENRVSSSYVDRDGLYKKIKPFWDRDGQAVVQRYAPRVRERGETRVLVIGGENVGAVRTLPRGEGTFLSNTAKGAHVDALDRLPADVRETVDYGVEFMRDNNVSIARLDLIDHDGPKINEINLINPGTQAFSHNREALNQRLVDVVEQYQGSPSLQYKAS